TITDLYQICSAYRGVTESFPFDEETLVFKVGGKIFLLTSFADWEAGNPSVNLKCNPERALELREEYMAVQPGYHMNKKHWNTVFVHQDLPLHEIKKLIDHSYELVFQQLSKKLQEEINNAELR